MVKHETMRSSTAMPFEQFRCHRVRVHRIRIREFRSLRNLDLDLSPVTVVIGENNAGKTSLLDAIKLTLSHRWGLRGTGFQEYDFHLSKDLSDPKDSPGVSIEIECRESPEEPWSEDIIIDLQGGKILQTKADGTNLVTIRAEYKYNETASIYESTWCFLNLQGLPTRTPTSRASNLYSFFFNYVPVFSLSALRDAGAEFSSGSQFWGKLIKSINIAEEDWESVSTELDRLNEQLVSTNPKFAAIKTQLESVRSVISGSVDSIALRALPLRIWDLISKTEILLRAEEGESFLPLSRFGQGVQSLAVVNVFRAFIDNLLADEYETESSPILLMEEPESHLHPQAARAFYKELCSIPGQKIITTHSPYFLQNVPFGEIRLLRKTKEGVKAYYVRESFRARMERNSELDRLLTINHEIWSYDEHPGELVIKGAVTDDQRTALLACYSSGDEMKHNHPAVHQLHEDSNTYMSENELALLQDSAKRIRGEIFFARKWLLVEGQSDYIFMAAAAELLDYSFDSNGVSIIDSQNCGSPGGFAALARAFGFPWAALFDGDGGGNDCVRNIKKQGFGKNFMTKAVLQFPAKTDLEAALVGSLPQAVTDTILVELKKYDGKSAISNKRRIELFRNHKILVATKVGEQIRSGKVAESDLPKEVVSVVNFLKSTGSYR